VAAGVSVAAAETREFATLTEVPAGAVLVADGERIGAGCGSGGGDEFGTGIVRADGCLSGSLPGAGAPRLRELATAHGDEDAGLNNVFAANLNLDMIGRLDKSLILQAVGSSSIWPGEIERRNAPVGLPLTLQRDSYLPTDASSFYMRKVPVLAAFTGAHEDYHSPRDTADKINYPGTAKITRLMGLIARSLAQNPEAPDYVEMERPKSQGTRGGLRAYLGTVPDYAQGDIEGVKLSGVAKLGPAQKAGVQGGDIITSLGGNTLKNIYDYTYALGEVKIGEETTITVLRDGETIELKITPGSRD